MRQEGNFQSMNEFRSNLMNHNSVRKRNKFLHFHEFYSLFVESVGPNSQKFLFFNEFCVPETKPGKGKTL